MNETRQSGEIVSRNGRNYTIEADSGGKLFAESDNVWPVRTRVIVVAGVIVARAGKVRKIKYYEV